MKNLTSVDKTDLIEKALICIAVMQFLMIFQISMKRFFDFDEFQVLYASAALLRGKALYQDQVGTHFPLVNIIFALFLKIYGFKTTALLAARMAMVLCLVVSLLFSYKITRLFSDRKTGIFALILIMSSLAFVHKGIEIRHDVFNMMFNAIGVFYALRYLKEKKITWGVLSACFLGLALASTQKAVVWNVGIMCGFFFATFDFGKDSMVSVVKHSFIYVFFWMLPLALSLAWLMSMHHETFGAFLQTAVIDNVSYLHPTKDASNPFPHDKSTMFLRLIHDNAVFYMLGILGGIFLVIKNKRDKRVWILGGWLFMGLFFYIYMRRPFYQSFLPTIPALGVSAALFTTFFITYLRRHFDPSKRRMAYIVAYALAAALLIVWPLRDMTASAMAPSSNRKQLENVEFCLKFLQPKDEVLCFSQQQVFFDAIFPGMRNGGCGKKLIFGEKGYAIDFLDQACFKKAMINRQCKIIIYDVRTHHLNQPILKMLKENYKYAGVGHILIPGFEVPPNQTIKKKIWISGRYFCPSLEMSIDGKKIKENMVDLKSKSYVFRNLTNKEMVVLYAFHLKEV